MNVHRNQWKVLASIMCLVIAIGIGIFFILSPSLPIRTSDVHLQLETPRGTGSIQSLGTVSPENTSSSQIVQPGFQAVPVLYPNPTRYANAKANPASSSATFVATNPTSLPPLGNPQRIQLTFDGTSSGSASPSFNTCNCFPSDVQVAAGPDHVVELVNTEAKVYNKSTQIVKNFTLNSLFNTPDLVSDPKVLFDSQSGRWFATVQDSVLSGLTITSASVKIVVSATNDPTGTFHLYGVSDSGKFPDQPVLGISDDKVVVSANMFQLTGTRSFLGNEFWVLNKTEMLAGTAVPSANFGPDPARFSNYPVQSLSSTSTQFIIGDDTSVSTQIWLTKVTGTPPSVTASLQAITMATAATPPNALQPGTTFTLETGDGRILDAAWQNSNLWTTWNDACNPPGDAVRSCVRVIEISTSSIGGTLTQDFDFGNFGQHFFYPAIRPDSQGNLDIVFGFSSSTVSPSIAITGEQANQLNTVSSSSPILVQGTAPVTSTNDACNPANACRYGDYFGAGVDPTSPTIIWVGGEFVTSSNPWQTRLGTMTTVTSTVIPDLPFGNLGLILATLLAVLSYAAVQGLFTRRMSLKSLATPAKDLFSNLLSHKKGDNLIRYLLRERKK